MATAQVLTFSADLMRVTGCIAADVKYVELLMRDRSPILGELDRRTFSQLARSCYDVLKFIRTDDSPDSVWLLSYVEDNAH